MTLITDKIFENLDTLSLSNAEEVSAGWAKVIKEGEFWEKLFKKNVSSLLILIYAILVIVFVVLQVLQSYDWKVMKNCLNIAMAGVLSEDYIMEQHEYKKAFFLITQKLEVCNFNSELAGTFT